MILVKVKSKDIRLTIPVPYTLLSIAIPIVTSKILQRNLNKWTKKHFERKEVDFIFPSVDKKILKPLVKELKKNKGLVLVDIKASDGSEVKVRL